SCWAPRWTCAATCWVCASGHSNVTATWCASGSARPGRAWKMHLLFHPDAAHRVLAGWPANYRKENVFYSEVRSAFGDGLLTTQDAEWQRQKRYLQPLFVARRVNGYATAMTEQVQQVVQRWRARPPGTVDLHE